MASKGSIWASIGLNTEKFKKSLLDLQVKTKGLGNSMSRGLSGINPLTLGVAAGFASIGAAVMGTLDVINDFSKAQSEVKAVLGDLGTDKAMESLSKQAKDLGASTAFTAAEVSQLQTELAKLGFNPKEIQDMAESTLDAAAALGSELGEQAALSGAALKSFSLDSSQAARVNDVLAKAASSSALDFSKLSTALPIVGATAKVAGVSLERTTAMLGVLSDRGIDASTSATALRNMFLELADKGLTFEEAMAKINTSTNKNKTAMELFGTRGATVGVILAETGVSVDTLTEKLEGAEGAAKAMADTMLNNLSGDVTKAKSAWEGFILSIEDGDGVISKAMRNLTQEFTGFLSKLTALNNEGLDGLGKSILGEARGAGDEIKGLGVSFNQMTAAANNNKAMFESLTKSFKAGKIDAEKYKQGVESLAGGWKALTLSEKANKANKVSLTEEQKKSAAAIKEETLNALNAATSVKELSKAQIEAAQSSKRLSDALSFDLLPTNEEYKEAIQKGINAIKDSEGFDKSPMTVKVPAKIELQPQNTQEGGAIITGEMIKLGEQAGTALSGALITAANGALVGLGEALGTGNIAAFGETLVNGFSGLLKSFGEQMIQLGLGMLALKAALALGPLGAGLAIGGGIALIAAAAAIQSSLAQSSAQPFAKGGIVGSPTMGLVGEYAGARHNPEVIAPLDKLQGMLMGSNGMQEIKITGHLVGRGKDLIGVINTAEKVSRYSN